MERQVPDQVSREIDAPVCRGVGKGGKGNMPPEIPILKKGFWLTYYCYLLLLLAYMFSASGDFFARPPPGLCLWILLGD